MQASSLLSGIRLPFRQLELVFVLCVEGAVLHVAEGGRKFTVTITTALEIEVFDESGKKLKNLPWWWSFFTMSAPPWMDAA